MVEVSIQTILGITVTLVLTLLSITLWFLYRISLNLEGLGTVEDDTKRMTRLLYEMTGRVDTLPAYDSEALESDLMPEDTSDHDENDDRESEKQGEDESTENDTSGDEEESEDEELSDEIDSTVVDSLEKDETKLDEFDPDYIEGTTYRIQTGYGKLYVTVNEAPETGRPVEIFTHIGNAGGFTHSFTEAIAKSVSVALQSGAEVEDIVDILEGIRSPKVAWDQGEQIQSIPDAIGVVLRRHNESGDTE